MATLRMPKMGMLFPRNEPQSVKSPRALAFAEAAYKKTGGPTKDLRRVYDAFLENERRKNLKGK